MSEIAMGGLDGSNPLAFLAALGVLEVVTDRGAAGRLHWRYEGTWLPVLTGCGGEREDLIAWIDEDRQACKSDPALALAYDGKQDLKAEPTIYREYVKALAAAATTGQRRSVDWAGAFASEVVTDNNGNTKPTALHFTAGQQQFLKLVNELADGATHEDFREALVGPWRYERPLPVMGWDATVARDYALRASNPSGDKKLGVPGADWLAVRGLAGLPVAPVRSRLHTTGCAGGWKSGSFAWALWTVALERSMVRGVLRLSLAELSAEERTARGIAAVLRSDIIRSDQGGYGTFTPAAVI